MTQVRTDFTRLAAPSFKALAIAGLGRPVKGQRPLHRVIVARDNQGRQWQHEKIFGPSEINKALEIARAVEERGYICADHWRQTQREY